MPIMVIGSNSFSGSHMVDLLLDEGHYVVGVSRGPIPPPEFASFRMNPRIDSFRFHQLNIDSDRDELVDLVAEQKPSHILSFASQGMVAQSWERPEDWYRTNLLSQVVFHDAIRRFSFIERYVHVSTPEVYGTTEGWVKESFDFLPSTPYAISRAACDLHLRSFHEAYGFPVAFTRAANVFGPGQQPYRIVPKTMISARLGRRLPLDGGGFSRRSFIHIRDVCAATLAIALGGANGQVYHISTRDAISIHDLVARILAMMNVAYKDVVAEAPERLGKDQDYLLDSTLLRNEFGWHETLSLDDGLAETLRWVDANLDFLSTQPREYVHRS